MKTKSESEMAGAWAKAWKAAGIYLLVVAVSELAAHRFLSSSRAQSVEWVLFLSSTVLVALLVRRHLTVTRIGNRKQKEIAELFSVIRGKDFFPLLARHLARVMEAECAMICEVTGADEERLRSVAAVCRGRLLVDFEFSVTGTPAGEVLRKGREVHLPSGGKERFAPTDIPRELVADSFLGVPLLAPSGRAIGLLAVLDDRSLQEGQGSKEIIPLFAVRAAAELDRRRTEEALLLSEARYRALYRDNPTMIFTLDAEWKILSANPICSSLLGYEIEELEGRSGLRVFHEEDRPAVAEQLQNCLRNPGQVYRWQFRKIRKNGDIMWVEEIAQGVHDPKGAPNILVVCQDITERKKAQEEIERLNADLVERATELEDVNRDLETFNYAVAHDLRKPLTTVNGYCQILRDECVDKLDKRCNNYLREAYEATRRMNQLIETLLNFAQLTGIELHRERIDLSATAHAVASDLRLAEPNRRVTLRITEGISVLGDPDLLRVVLENLLGNAWKYTGKREETIIEFGLTLRGGERVYFVRDNGSGFDMAHADKLFMPLQRLPGTGAFKGHGIGLASAERIIRRHGGRIWAEGEPGRGATFYFTLPAD